MARPDVWSPRFFVFCAVLFELLSIATDLIRLRSDSYLWLVIQLLTLATFVVLALVYKLLFFAKPRSKKAALVANLIAVAILGGIHNFLVAYLAQSLGLDPNVFLRRRAIGGMLMGLAIFVIYGFAFSDQMNRTEARNKVANLRSELKAYLDSSKQMVQDEFELQANQIRATLEPKLDYVQGLMKARNSSQDTVRLLRYLVQSDVRPMSSELARKQSTILIEQTREVAHGQIVIDAKYSLSKAINPLAFFLGVGFAISLFDDVSVEVSEPVGLAVSAVTAAALFGVKFLARKSAPVGDKRLIFKLFALAIGVFAFAWFLFAVLGTEHIYAMLLYFALGALVSLYLTASYAVLGQYRTQLHDEIDRTNAKLQLAITQLRQSLWLGRRQLISQLHGTVQGAITAAVTRLSNADPNDPEVLELAQQDLDRAVSALQSGPVVDLDILEALESLRISWEGVCDFTWELSAEDLVLIDKAPETPYYISAIATEAVSNAVRHGGAKKAHLCVYVSEDSLLGLQILNDGTLPESNIQEGTGSKLITELTADWRFLDCCGETLLDMKLPLAGQDLVDQSLSSAPSNRGGGLSMSLGYRSQGPELELKA